MGKSENGFISIIVPVYNVEEYLEECVQSIVRQSYQNIEILLVDDGSTDGSGALCDEMAKKDSRIQALHKENGGLSDARNYGIEHASGSYIMFVDSDDLVDAAIVEQLYGILSSEPNTKLAVCGLAHFADGEKPEFLHEEKSVAFTKEDALVDFLCQKRIPTSACGKLYAKDLLDNLRFVKGQRFEDNEFTFRVLSRCEAVAYSESKLYAYRHRSNSITTSKFDEKEFDIVEIGKRILEETALCDPAIRSAATVYQCTNCFRIFLTISDDFKNDERYMYCKQYLRENAKSAIKDENIRGKLKLGLLLFSVGVPQNALRLLRNKKKRWS